jgi:hypothetical protein
MFSAAVGCVQSSWTCCVLRHTGGDTEVRPDCIVVGFVKLGRLRTGTVRSGVTGV